MPTAVRTRPRKRSLTFEQRLGKLVAERRHKLGLTQATVARRVNCSPQHIADIEHGRGVGSLPKMLAVAEALETELHELLREAA